MKSKYKKIFSFFIKNFFTTIIIFFSIVYISLVMHMQVSVNSNLVHDDALFWNNANQIIRGNWLGSYNQMTLAKGPGFPLFLAFNYILGIPITLSISLFYIMSLYIFIKTLKKFRINQSLLLFLFLFILFHPALFPTRIIRDNIYPSLTLLVISGFMEILFFQKISKIKIFFYSLCLALFWITREEGVWIIPGIFILIFLKIFQLIKLKKNISIKSFFYKSAFLFAITLSIIALISLKNYQKYHYFGIVDFKSHQFSKVIKKLNSVKIEKEIPHLPVPFEKRKIIYEISPSFSELKNYFENKGKGWTDFGCELYPSTCGDYAGGWFVWALRDSATDLGYYRNFSTANQFYKNINKEIDVACQSNLIQCNKNPIPFMPKISNDQIKLIPNKVLNGIKVLTLQGSIETFANDSFGPLENIKEMEKFLGRPLRTYARSETLIQIDGWYYSNNDNWLIIKNILSNEGSEIEIERIASPDIVEFFDDSNANFQRFSIKVPVEEGLAISTDSIESNYLLLDKIHEGDIEINPKETLFIDKVVKINNNTNLNTPIKIKIFLIKIYKIISPVLMLIGLFIYLVYLLMIIFKKNIITDLFIITTSLWILFFSRIFLLVLIDISSFPAINQLYMAPAFLILYLASSLSIYLFIEKNND